LVVTEAIAEAQVVFEHPDGGRTPGLILIEKPYVVDENEARCAVIIDGLHERMPDVAGNGTLQALLMAVAFCGGLLRDFVESGGRILIPDEGSETEGEEIFDLEACFSPLARIGVPNSRRRNQRLRQHA
jgi:hypothetical protein